MKVFEFRASSSAFDQKTWLTYEENGKTKILKFAKWEPKFYKIDKDSWSQDLRGDFDQTLDGKEVMIDQFDDYLFVVPQLFSEGSDVFGSDMGFELWAPSISFKDGATVDLGGKNRL